MKKIYLYALLASGLWQARALTPVNPVLGNHPIILSTVQPPDCNILTPSSATATSGNATLAIDGLSGTRWESDFSDPQSITIDYGALVNVSTVTIDWETANAKDYFLRGSVDGITWVDIAAKTDMPTGVRTDVIENIGAQYRYLKMDGVSRNTPYGYSIFEFNVCDNAITPPPVCNVVVPVSATASTGVAGLAIDVNEGTRWESEASDPQSLTVDYGAPVDISSVNIDWETANAKDYTLQGSVDGTTWVDIETLTNMPTGPRTDIIDGITAQYRYLKMNGISRNTPYGYSIYEFKLCGPAIVIPPFVCTALPVASATATTGVAALAIDGNEGTRWESDATDAQSITADLGALANINGVTIHWETANAKDYFLRASVDGVTWVDIANKTNMPAGERTDVIDGIAAQYRYIKMDGVTRNTPYGYSIYELKVCGEAIVVIPPFICTQLATSLATATSGNADLAIDGDEGTRWESDATDAQSITADLGALANINGVTIHWETANAKDYVLRGSVDGIAWVDIATKTDMPAGERTDVIDGITAQYRYIKMDGVTRNTAYGYSIYEIKVCGEAIPVPVDCDMLAAASATATSGNATLAIDGNEASRWESEFTDAQSLTVDLGVVTGVNVVTIDWETANAKDYVLRGSVDGDVWTDIETLTNMATGERTDVIDGINTQYRYLKMDGVIRNTPYGYSIYEFKVCGEGPQIVINYTEIPALIQAEDYTAMNGVQEEATADTGGGESVGWIDAGDWMDYAIYSPTATNYQVDIRVASAEATGVIELLNDGASLGTVAVPNTGGWQLWQTISKTISLTQGNHTIRVQPSAIPFNLNWIEFKIPQTAGVSTFNKNTLAVYPNPAHGFVNVEIQADGELYIFNSYGSLIQQQAVKAGKNTIELDNYAAGLYILKADNKAFKLIIR